MTKVILTHAVADVERWLSFKGERAASIGAMGGSNVVDHVAADGSKVAAISMNVPDTGAFQSALASPPTVTTWSSCGNPTLYPRDATRTALRDQDGILLCLSRVGHSAATRIQVSLGGSS